MKNSVIIEMYNTDPKGLKQELDYKHNVEGICMSKLATYYFTSNDTLEKHMKLLGVKITKQYEERQKVRPSKAELTKLLDKMSPRDVAIKYGVARSTISNWRNLYKIGEKDDPDTTRSTRQDKEVIKTEEALKVQRLALHIGQRVRVRGEFIAGQHNVFGWKTRTGTVKAVTGRMFVVDFGLYPQSWTWIDVAMGNCKIELVGGAN